MAPISTIEQINTLSLTDFRSKFWPPNADKAVNASSAYKDTPFNLNLNLTTSSALPNELFDLCYDLIRSTSSAQYAASSLGWHPSRKRREMRLVDLRYILLGESQHTTAEKRTESVAPMTNSIDGFLSFMFTYEDGIAVIYCYELHLQERYQGKGLGKCLMRLMEDIGREAGVEKAMLTVFRANEAARGFYETLGYVEDAFSPRPKILRGGIVKESDYIILSKPLLDNSR
jgi:GNAT superfamily N-acetyltransferase